MSSFYDLNPDVDSFYRNRIADAMLNASIEWMRSWGERSEEENDGGLKALLMASVALRRELDK